MDETGQMLVRLVDVKIPKKYNLGEPEICSTCGSITVAGIFEVENGSDGLRTSDLQPNLVSADYERDDYEDPYNAYEEDQYDRELPDDC